MAIKDLYPEISPSLNLDFARVKALDPKITFSRASTGTYYGARTAKAEENLLIRSQEFDNAVWLKTNASITADNTSAPDGTTTADTVTFSAAGGGQNARQQLTLIVGATYTFSVFLKGVAGETVTLEMDTISTVITLSASWDRYSVSGVNANASTAVRIVSRSGNTATVFDAWGAQLEQRSAVTAYTPTTTQPITNYIPVLETASANTARFNHDPVTGESLGLLVEEQRTNLLTYSEQFDNAAWIKSNATITSNIIVAPDGTLTGDKLVEDATASAKQVYSGLIALTSGTSYTGSVFIRAGEETTCRLAFDGSRFVGSPVCDFNLSTGTATPSDCTASITPVGNGWYRCSISAACDSTGNGRFYINLRSASYTGNGYSGIYIWGAQLESGQFSTSYVKTEASQVTRSADSASITGSNFSSWYRQDEGTLFVDYSFIPSAPRSFSNIYEFSDGTANNRIFSRYPSFEGIENQIITNNSAQANLIFVFSQNGKIALAYKMGDVAGVINSGSASTDSTVVLPLINQIGIGWNGRTGSQINGHISKFSYYPKRTTNAQLQALTS